MQCRIILVAAIRRFSPWTAIGRSDCAVGELYTDPNELMEPIHNRMPGDFTHPPIDLLRPYDTNQMKAWRVSSDVGNVRNNRPELVEPISG